MTARRVGLTPTSRRRSSASGWIAPATSQKAAADDVARDPLVDRLHDCASLESRPPAPPSPPARAGPPTPRARSIRSVWSRVATASRTVVRPSARSAASRIADLTWALGTGVVYVDRPERGATDHGQRWEGIVRAGVERRRPSSAAAR